MKEKLGEESHHLQSKVHELQNKLSESTGDVREKVIQSIGILQTDLTALRTTLDERTPFENEMRQTVYQIAILYRSSYKRKS